MYIKYECIFNMQQTKVTDLCKFVYIFVMPLKNVIQKMNSLACQLTSLC